QAAAQQRGKQQDQGDGNADGQVIVPELGAEGQAAAVHQAGDRQRQRQVQDRAVQELHRQGLGREITAAGGKALPDRSERVVQRVGQQRQAKTKTDEGGGPQRLNGAGDVGQGGGAVHQRLRPEGQQRQPGDDAGQVFQRVDDVHYGKSHRVGGISVSVGACILQAAGGGRGGHDLAALGVAVVMLVDDAGHHEYHEQKHQQAGAGITQGAVPHKDHQDAAGSQQQQAFAAEF